MTVVFTLGMAACANKTTNLSFNENSVEMEFVCPVKAGCWKHVSVSTGHPKHLYILKPDPAYLKSGAENLWLSCDKSEPFELPKDAEVCIPSTDPRSAPCGKIVCRQK